MRTRTVIVGPLAAPSATNIRTASSATAGAMVLNGSTVIGGVAVLDTARQILFTTGASEAGHTVLVTGTSKGGQTQSETVTLPSSATTVATVLSYKSLTSAVISATSNNTISIGTNGVAESQWVRFDNWSPGSTVTIQTGVSGTANLTVRTTLDDPNSATNPVALASVQWFDSGDSSVVSATAAAQSSLSVLPTFAKVVLNSQTNPGYVTATFLQVGNVSL